MEAETQQHTASLWINVMDFSLLYSNLNVASTKRQFDLESWLKKQDFYRLGPIA
jgi:hypothetical protein